MKYYIDNDEVSARGFYNILFEQIYFKDLVTTIIIELDLGLSVVEGGKMFTRKD